MGAQKISVRVLTSKISLRCLLGMKREFFIACSGALPRDVSVGTREKEQTLEACESGKGLYRMFRTARVEKSLPFRFSTNRTCAGS